MTSKRRPASIAFPRQVAMYLARELTKASLNEIGDAFGGRDHGTVLHACKLVKRRMKEQDSIRQTISFIDSALQRTVDKRNRLPNRSEEHTSELQSHSDLVCRLLLEKKKKK